MGKSLFTPDYAVFIRVLRTAREAAGVTQVQLAEKVATTQSIVSKWERGEIRLDIVQLRQICQALGIPLRSFIAEFEQQLAKKSARRR